MAEDDAYALMDKYNSLRALDCRLSDTLPSWNRVTQPPAILLVRVTSCQVV